MKIRLDSVDAILNTQITYARIEAKYNKLCKKGKKPNPIIEENLEAGAEAEK